MYQIVKNLVVLTTILSLSNAQIPDPMCPYPSDELVYFPYPGDCTKYWECFEGNKYLYTCPEGLWWHEAISECDYPGDFCDPSSTTGPTPTPTPGPTETTSDFSPDPMCPYPSDKPVYFPYSGDCTKYWECFEGHKYLYTCPTGLWWHEAINECDYPGDFCDGSTVPTSSSAPTRAPTPITTGTPDEMCEPASSTITYFPYPGDCTKYIECFEGDKYIRNCPNGLWWHESISECDYPGDFCTNSTISTTSPAPTTAVTSTTPTGTPDEMCQPASSTITYFPYPGDCTKYIECYEGDKYIMHCPNGLWWHEAISECDYPGDFCDPSSTTGPTPTPTPGPTEATSDFTPDSMCPYPSDKPVYFPYPGDCTKYWECLEGHKYLYTCPPGLWWHEDVSECDYPGDYCDDSKVAARRNQRDQKIAVKIMI